MKKILFSTFIFCFLALTASEVFACSCLSDKPEVKEAYEDSAAVFYGKVIKITQKPKSSYLTVKFKVEKAWKNRSGAEIIIQTGQGGGSCGFHFEVGKKYLVYADDDDESALSTSICQRTSGSNADARYLDKIKKPKLFPK